MSPVATSARKLLSFRDPVHGFIRADALESALIESRILQRLRYVKQLGLNYLVFPGAEHSRFSHALGTMELAGRVYDALSSKNPDLLDSDPACAQRRLVRVAALLHDAGHAPFSHSAEDLFEGGIDHEEMTCRLLRTDEVAEVFDRFADGLEPSQVESLLRGGEGETGRLLAEIVSGELDVDKMDYLLRDSLFCGVRYGSYDLERILDTIVALRHPDTGQLGIGVEEGGVHALEALVMARYYMFTQVYLNVTGKVLEQHFNAWLRDNGVQWNATPSTFLDEDDITTVYRLRQSSSLHADAILKRRHFSLAHQTKEHLSRGEKRRFEDRLRPLIERFGSSRLLVANSSKDPHRLGDSGLLVRLVSGELQSMAQASHFIRHLTRIDRYFVFCDSRLRNEITEALTGE